MLLTRDRILTPLQFLKNMQVSPLLVLRISVVFVAQVRVLKLFGKHMKLSEQRDLLTALDLSSGRCI